MHGERRRKRVFVVLTITNIKDREVLKLHNFLFINGCKKKRISNVGSKHYGMRYFINIIIGYF